MRTLEVEGLLEIRTGTDAVLRDGNWTTRSRRLVDLAYRCYDEEHEHNRLRHEYFGPMSAEIARLQFEI